MSKRGNIRWYEHAKGMDEDRMSKNLFLSGVSRKRYHVR